MVLSGVYHKHFVILCSRDGKILPVVLPKDLQVESGSFVVRQTVGA